MPGHRPPSAARRPHSTSLSLAQRRVVGRTTGLAPAVIWNLSMLWSCACDIACKHHIIGDAQEYISKILRIHIETISVNISCTDFKPVY